MADINLKTETPDTSLPADGFLFGADSQAAAAPSVYTTQSVATRLLGSTSLSGATVTASAPLLDLSQIWNNAGVTFTGLKANFTDTASNAASLLMDLQVDGTNKFSVRKDNKIGQTGISFLQFANSALLVLGANATTVLGRFNSNGLTVPATSTIGFTDSSPDLILRRRAAANLQLGAADAAAPVAQTLSVQSVVAGTTNTAGANLTITGSQGTGSGAGGSIIFQVAPAGSSGTAQNALSTALTITSGQRVQASSWIDSVNGLTVGSSTPDVVIGAASSYGVTLRNTAPLAWTSADATATQDVILRRDAANTLALRNGTNAQVFRVYNTYTSDTNYERGKIEWASNALRIGTEKGSGGGTARALELQTDGTTRLTVATNGQVYRGSPSSASLALGYGFTVFGNSANTPGLQQIASEDVVNTSNGGGIFSVVNNPGGALNSGTRIGAFLFTGSSSSSSLRATCALQGFASQAWVDGSAYGSRFEFATTANNSTTRTTRLIIGNGGIISLGATEANTVPALKPSSTTLQARLADDSAFTNIQGKITTDTNYTAGAPTADGYLVLYDAAGTAYKVPCVAV